VLRAVDRFDGGPAYAAAMALGAYCYAALRPVELGKNDADVLWEGRLRRLPS